MKKVKLSSYITALIFLFIGTSTYAQNAEKNVAIKLYAHFGWSTFQKNSIYNPALQTTLLQKNQNFYLGPISPAVTFAAPSGNFHEVALSQFRLNREYRTVTVLDSTNNQIQVLDGEVISTFAFQLRYEYNFLLRRNNTEAKLKPYIGISGSPYVRHGKLDPLLSFLYGYRSTAVGVSLAIVPRITYDINERWFLDANFRFSFANANIASTVNNDPVIPEEQRRFTAVNTNFFSNAGIPFRIGVGLKI